MALLEDNTRLRKLEGDGITLSQIASCLRDYRVNTKGQFDLGMLKTSPKVKNASVRRPLNVDFTKEENIESTMQSKNYGYAGVPTYSKYTTGSGTTLTFMNKVLEKGRTAPNHDFWEAESISPTNRAGICFFDGYYNLAQRWGEGDKIMPLVKQSIIRGNEQIGSTLILAADQEGDTGKVGANLYTEPTLLVNNVSLVFVSNVDGQTPIYKVKGYLRTSVNNTEIGDQQYFELDTTGRADGETWTDVSGNECHLDRPADLGYKPRVTVKLHDIPYMYNLDKANNYELDYEIRSVYNESVLDGDKIPMSVKLMSDGVYNAKAVNYFNDEFVGFYYEENNKGYDRTEWDRSVNGLATPYEFFFTNKGVTDHKPIFFVRITRTNGVTENYIVNPFHYSNEPSGVISFKGYVLYDFLGVSQDIKSVELVKAYGDSSFLENGYVSSVTTTDSRKYVIAPDAYREIQNNQVEA
jgi:hypothetical protein